MRDGFGHWFAGFADGEGCFKIVSRYGGRSYECSFAITLRRDDVDILREIQKQTGLGRIYMVRGRGGTDKPQACWSVFSKRDCLELVRLFDRYPLRAKKREDFAIWRKAVIAMQSIVNGSKRNDWSELAFLRDGIRRAREYAEPGSDVADLVVPVDGQLTF